MKLLYNNKDIDLYECKSFFSRLKGFMFTRNIDKALLFDRCNSIHTFFMKENIDIIFCNEENIIVSYFKNISPNKVILPQKKATKTIELPPNYYQLKIGQRLEIK